MTNRVGKSTIYGLSAPRDSWLIEQLGPIVDAGMQHIDGTSIALNGVGQNCEIVVEIHGFLNPSQLRMLADAVENVPR